MRKRFVLAISLTMSLSSLAAHAGLLWDGDAKKGVGVFQNIQPR